MLNFVKSALAGVAVMCALSGLIWFATTHLVLCLGAIAIYVVYEITMGGEKEL